MYKQVDLQIFTSYNFSRVNNKKWAVGGSSMSKLRSPITGVNLYLYFKPIGTLSICILTISTQIFGT